MKGLCITSDNLCIKRLLTVVRGRARRTSKLIPVKSRHCDAFIFVLGGVCTYRFGNGEEFTARDGDVFYLAHRAAYRMLVETEEFSFIFCDFEFDSEEDRHCALYPSESLTGADSLFSRLLNRYVSHENTYTECMSILYSIYSALQKSTAHGYIGKNNESVIADAKSYIDENFKSTMLSIWELARRAGISEVYLRRLFKARYGISPQKYINSVRIENAKRLMKYHFLTLDECARESGFSSLQYFCRIFKEAEGISPGNYRRNVI